MFIEIQSKQIEFYSVTLHITADFSGLRYILFYYPMISGFIGISTNLCLILFIGFMCWCYINRTWISNQKEILFKIILKHQVKYLIYQVVNNVKNMWKMK